MKKLLCSWFLLILVGSYGNLQMEARNAPLPHASITIHLVRVAEDMDFVNAIFSLNGEYEIGFLTVK